MTKDNTLSYNIMTSVKDTAIMQVVSAESVAGVNSMRDLISQRIVDTQDAQTRKALIDLGWSPPETTKAVTNTLNVIERIYQLSNVMDEDPSAYKEWVEAQNAAPELVERALKELRGE